VLLPGCGACRDNSLGYFRVQDEVAAALERVSSAMLARWVVVWHTLLESWTRSHQTALSVSACPTVNSLLTAELPDSVSFRNCRDREGEKTNRLSPNSRAELGGATMLVQAAKSARNS
jgi:hypothetical protein